jgi:hypothetical protein
MCDAAGIACEKVTGHSKGYGFKLAQGVKQFQGKSGNHAWNAVKVNDEWALVDACWSAGHLSGSSFQRKLNEHYFLTEPAEFFFDHFPIEKKWQLQTPQRSLAAFAQLCHTHGSFFRCGLKTASHPNAMVKSSNAGACTITLSGAKTAALLCTVRNRATGAELENAALIQTDAKDANLFVTRLLFKTSGTYDVAFFAKFPSEPTSYHSACDYVVDVSNGAGADACFPKRMGSRAGVRLFAPLSGVLAAGTSVDFRIRCDGAKSVAILPGFQKFTSAAAASSGDVFTATVKIPHGKFSIGANYTANSFSYVYTFRGK